jgi:hypothetical protein
MPLIFEQYKAYFYLALVLLLVGVFGYSNYWSYNHGKEVIKGEIALEKIQSFEDSIKAFNKLAKTDQDAAVKAETDRQQAKINQIQRRTKLEQDIKLSAAYTLSDNSMQLLRESIREANGSPTTGKASSSNGKVSGSP